MANTKISEFSSTPGNNTDIDGINIAEGCAPSGINNAIRELMSQLKDFQAGTAGDSFNGPIGTTTAAAVSATTLTTSSTVTLNGGTANGVPYLNGSKVLTSGSALQFDGSNIGLGVTPSAWNSTYNAFDLGGSSVSGRTSTNNQLDLASNGFRNAAGNWVYKYTGGAVRLTVDGSGSGFQWYNAPSGTAGNAISFTQAMTLDSSGNLLVGVTSGGTHRVYKTNNTGEALQIQNNSTTNGSRCLELTMLTNGDGSGTFVRCGDSGAFRFQVLGNGNAQNVNNSYGAISDAKLKENVTDATPKLEKLQQVRIVNFNMIGDEQKQIGVIAQELEQVFPGMVDESPDRDAEGNDLGTTTKSVKYSVFVPMLIKAIQEQQAIITALTARIESLESK